MGVEYSIMKKTLIERIDVDSSGESNVVFSSISQEYDGLLLICSVRNDSTNLTFDIHPNGSSADRTRTTIQGSGAAATAATGTDITPLQDSSAYTANTFASTSVFIPNYTGSQTKGFSIESVTENDATTSYQRLQAGLWSNANAITSLELSTASLFAEHSSFTLYGVSAGSDGSTSVA